MKNGCNHDEQLKILLNYIQGVSHSNSNNQYFNYEEFRNKYLEILEKCSDNELLLTRDRLSHTKYFNVIIQAQKSALEFEINKRKNQNE